MTTSLFTDGIARSAKFSVCGRYRYQLCRRWGDGLTVAFVMLNPSTADGQDDDNTIRRCIGFAMAWGYEQLIVANLFAWRSTDPFELLQADEPIGPDNDAWIVNAALAADLTVCAWGGFADRPRLVERAAHVEARLREVAHLHHLGLTQGGRPRHPLRLPAKLTPQAWRVA